MPNMRIFSKHYEAEVQRRKYGVFVHISDKAGKIISTQEFPTKRVRQSVERYMMNLDDTFEKEQANG